MNSKKERAALIAIFILLLCQCTVKHQPKTYSLFFQEGYSTKKEREQYKERVALEENYANLTLLQKKRLYDLYDFELSRVKLGDPIRKELEEKFTRLQLEVSPLLEIAALSPSSSDPKAEKVNTDYPWNARLKKVRELWNKDENEKAFTIVEEISATPEFLERADAEEKYKIQLLKFRILQDNFSSPKLLIAYERLKELAPCKAETTQAGFVLALRSFLNGKKEEALSLFESQCDEDKSLSNNLRRTYWQMQFNSDSEKRAQTYAKLMQYPVYGYYQYLAKVANGEDYFIPLPKCEPMQDAFTVPSSVSDNLKEAEVRLDWNLRKDTLSYLLKASEKLKNEPDDNVDALLYVIKLFQASGNHLEAVKLYGNLQSSFQKNESFVKLNNQWTCLYPRPYTNTVEWVSKQWNVSDNFIWSIMRQESAFNAFATSVADARGLMQLMPFLAKEMSKEWKYRSNYRDRGMYSTDENIKMGAFHLHQLFKYLEHPALVAASYNAGIQRVSRWTKRFGDIPLDVFIELIPINETRNYVKLVLRNYIHYHALENKGVVEKTFIPTRLPATVLP